jgi:hypothetical protein
LYSIKEISFIFTDKNSIHYNLLKTQITHLNIDIRSEKISSEVFRLILSVCKRLIHLNICQLLSYRNSAIHISEPPQSSNITKLKIKVLTIDDCLRLLNGQLKHLSKLIINVDKMDRSLPRISNKVNEIS